MTYGSVGKPYRATNPYLITGPALISFSGGRTSAYMLKQILDAHGGTLPDDVHVCFANTGKEREETLRFVHECGTRWGVRVRWLEWRDYRDEYARKEGAHRCWYEEVGYNSASRNGEPFDALIAFKGNYLPNGAQRFCSEQLKVLTMHRFMGDIGFPAGSYTEAIGLRADEQHRLLKMYGENVENGRKCIAPLAQAKIHKPDVMAFWRAQDFDLGLEPWEGNCTLCFQKGKGIRKRILRDDPSVGVWWQAKEAQCGGTWDKRDSVAGLQAEVAAQPVFELFDTSDPDDEHDAECGLWCAGEAA
jgi:3'-phosphoadenosine 5'-phosphosulfate sulfotransferase (PAPS reductase)/FAD synthetase